MARIKRTRRGITVELDPEERILLRGLPSELEPVVGAGAARPASGDEPASDPAGDDPIRQRLFPVAYLDPTEEQAEADWQAMVHSEIVEQKLAALATLAATLDDANGGAAQGAVKVLLTPEQADAWVSALNDARLALGVAIGVTEDDDPDAVDAVDPVDPEARPRLVYRWLTWLQGALVDELLGRGGLGV